MEGTSRVKRNVKFGLWVRIICLCRFLDCNKHTTLAQDVDSEGDCEVGQGENGNSVFSTQFCCEPKSYLKK